MTKQSRLNYHLASSEEMAEHFMTVSRSAVDSVKKHHKDNPEILERILKACELLKVLKLEKKLEALKR